MKTVTIRLDDETTEAAATLARECSMTAGEFYSEAVVAAVARYKRQRALARIDEDIVGAGANVSREEFEEAQAKMRRKSAGRK